MTTLREKAKKIIVLRKSVRKYSQEDFDLINAWLDDEVVLGQAAKSLDFKNNNQFLCYVAYGIREMQRRGIR